MRWELVAVSEVCYEVCRKADVEKLPYEELVSQGMGASRACVVHLREPWTDGQV